MEVYNDNLVSQVDILAFLGTETFPKHISEYIASTFLPKKLHKNIFSKTILSDTSTNKKLLKNQKSQLKKLNRERKIVE
jgi:translation elongation factor EF-4